MKPNTFAHIATSSLVESSVMLRAISCDPCASNWLKVAAKTVAQRDCLDALTDAEALVRLCKVICRENGITSV